MARLLNGRKDTYKIRILTGIRHGSKNFSRATAARTTKWSHVGQEDTHSNAFDGTKGVRGRGPDPVGEGNMSAARRA
jgi:hypothetical protein